MNLSKSEIHPSQFQNNTEINLKGNRTILNVIEERGQALTKKDIENLESPGKYDFTPDDTSISQSNTNSMFKNLYGETLLTFLFFSSKNVENIQKLIRMTVYKYTKQVIDNQSNTELLIVMRSLFLAYAKHPKLINENMPDKEKKLLLIQYTKEVDRLNQLVIDTTVPLIVSQLQQYLSYLDDASSPLKIMDKPINTSVVGTKNYRSQTQVLIGSEL
jgi:hypothetical protein